MIQIGTIVIGMRDHPSPEEYERYIEEIEARRQSPEGQDYLRRKKEWCEQHNVPFKGWDD